MALNKENDICEKISSEVKNTFLQIYNALKNRETQLLRQIEVLSQHYKLNESYDKCFKQVTIIFDNQSDVLTSIANFGRIDFNGLSSDSDFYKIEDYQKPERDHVSLYKYIENSYSEQLNESNNIQLDSPKVTHLFDEQEDRRDDKHILDATDDNLERNNADNSQDLIENDNIREYSFENVLSGTSNCDINYESVNNSNECDTDTATSAIVAVDESTNDVEQSKVCERVRKLSMKQPEQVKQWMKQIISEPEVEPAPTHVMEHSQISTPHQDTV